MLFGSVVATVVLAGALDGAGDPQPVGGGVAAQTCEWPSAVGMLDATGFVFCTGTLIHPEVVLFAAHCLEAVQPNAVAFGENADAPVRQVLTSGCQMHPDYSTMFFPDLAYCRLQTPVTDVPIVPPLMGCEADLLVPNAPVTIVGFGNTHATWDPNAGDWGTQMGAGLKRSAAQTVEEVYESSLILRGNNQGACPGDSGGPAMLQLVDGSWRVLGAAAAIHPDAPNEPNACLYGSVYELSHPYMTWLEGQVAVDLTPCHDADGTWNPTEQCTAFPTAPQQGGAAWASGCANGQVSPPGASCGPPNGDPGDPTGGGTGGADDGAAEETGYETGEDEESSGGFEDEDGGTGGGDGPIPGPSTGFPSVPRGRADEGCGCQATPSRLPTSLAVLGLLALVRRRA